MDFAAVAAQKGEAEPAGNPRKIAVINRQHAAHVAPARCKLNACNPFGIVRLVCGLVPFDQTGRGGTDDHRVNEKEAARILFLQKPFNENRQSGDVAMAFAEENQPFHAGCAAASSSNLALSTVNNSPVVRR